MACPKSLGLNPMYTKEEAFTVGDISIHTYGKPCLGLLRTQWTIKPLQNWWKAYTNRRNVILIWSTFFACRNIHFLKSSCNKSKGQNHHSTLFLCGNPWISPRRLVKRPFKIFDITDFDHSNSDFRGPWQLGCQLATWPWVQSFALLMRRQSVLL